MADSTDVVGETGEGAYGSAPSAKARATARGPSTYDMVLEALREIDDNPRKGTSVVSIRSWITNHYPTASLKSFFKRAVTKAVENGAIERPKKNDEVASVLLGRYRLTKAAKKPAAAKKPPAKKAAAAAKRETKKPAKKATISPSRSRGRSKSPKIAKRVKPGQRARARSVSATPRVSKSKKIRSRLSKSHSPLPTPKLIRAKPTTAAAKRKVSTAAAAKKAAAAAAKAKSPGVETSELPGKSTATKTTKKTKAATKDAKSTKPAKPAKPAAKKGK